MNITQFFKKDYIIGLDIGTSSVKFAQFAVKEDGLNLVKADLKEIPYTGDAAYDEKTVVDILKSLFKGVSVKQSKIVVTIDCPQTSAKIIQTPYMPKSELRKGIALEAKNHFPFLIDTSSLDFEVVGEVVEKGIRKYEVLVAVSPGDTVNKCLSVLDKLGIKPVSVVPSFYALGKFAAQMSLDKDKTICFMDIGADHTILVIFKGKVPVFSRKIPVAGGDFTKVMTGVLVSDRGKTELSLQEAEEIKKKIGIPVSGSGPEIVDDKISTTQISAMLRTPLDNMANEIHRCFDYYREETAGGKVESLILFGGGASLGGITNFLQEELDMEVKLGISLEGFKVKSDVVREKSNILHRLELAIGAAINKARGINLLPLEIKEQVQRKVKRLTVLVAATSLILVLSFIYAGMRIQITNYHKRISAARLELSGLQPQFKKSEAQHLANMVLVDEPHWEDVFKELSNLISSDIYLTSMSMEDGEIAMKGVIISKDGEQLVSDFGISLEKGIFKDVKLVKIKDLKDQTGNEFELKCWVD